jgi:hypothetical protein
MRDSRNSRQREVTGMKMALRLGRRRSRRATFLRWMLILAAVNALGSLGRSRRQAAGESSPSGGIKISGLGNSGNRLSQDARAERLARLIVDADTADPVSDETLSAIWAAVLERARSGEPDAAATVSEVARLQRA